VHSNFLKSSKRLVTFFVFIFVCVIFLYELIKVWLPFLVLVRLWKSLSLFQFLWILQVVKSAEKTCALLAYSENLDCYELRSKKERGFYSSRSLWFGLVLSWNDPMRSSWIESGRYYISYCSHKSHWVDDVKQSHICIWVMQLILLSLPQFLSRVKPRHWIYCFRIRFE